jgi:NADH:ubiquinone oxidoreductase subunit 4 (subunit M)
VHINFRFILLLSIRSGVSFARVLFLTHGFLSAALFYVVGEVYSSFGSRRLYYYKGLGYTNIVLTIVFC